MAVIYSHFYFIQTGQDNLSNSRFAKTLKLWSFDLKNKSSDIVESVSQNANKRLHVMLKFNAFKSTSDQRL